MNIIRNIMSILLIMQLNVSAGNTDLRFIREQFYLAVEDEEALIKLENYILENFSPDTSKYPAVILAYTGGIEALKAKHAFSPFSKFSHLLNSLDILESAVGIQPVDLEIRFIRFSILDNVPSFLGYNSEKETDKEMVMKLLLKNDFSKVDMELQKGIIEYLIESGELEESERSLLINNCVALKEK